MSIEDQVKFLKHMEQAHEKVAPLEAQKYRECANTILELQAKHSHMRKEILELIKQYGG